MIRSSRIRIPLQFTHYGLHMLIGGREPIKAQAEPGEKNKAELREFRVDQDDAQSSNKLRSKDILAGVK